jgi:hypothetical protein
VLDAELAAAMLEAPAVLIADHQSAAWTANGERARASISTLYLVSPRTVLKYIRYSAMAVTRGVARIVCGSFFFLLESPTWFLPVLLGGCLLLGLGIALLEHPLPASAWVGCTIGHNGKRKCRDCWDNLNGECARCNWTIPDLPQSLQQIASSYFDSRMRREGHRSSRETAWRPKEEQSQTGRPVGNAYSFSNTIAVERQWWDRVLGPEATQGRCQVCMASFEQADLRHCGRWRRLECIVLLQTVNRRRWGPCNRRLSSWA